MKVTRIYNQNRRDCDCDLECENCKCAAIGVSAYDDRNFWDNVVPSRKCEECGKATNDMDLKIKQTIVTRYAEGEQV